MSNDLSFMRLVRLPAQFPVSGATDDVDALCARESDPNLAALVRERLGSLPGASPNGEFLSWMTSEGSLSFDLRHAGFDIFVDCHAGPEMVIRAFRHVRGAGGDWAILDQARYTLHDEVSYRASRLELQRKADALRRKLGL